VVNVHDPRPPASLCPRLACSTPLGQRTARSALVPDEPKKTASPRRTNGNPLVWRRGTRSSSTKANRSATLINPPPTTPAVSPTTERINSDPSGMASLSISSCVRFIVLPAIGMGEGGIFDLRAEFVHHRNGFPRRPAGNGPHNEANSVGRAIRRAVPPRPRTERENSWKHRGTESTEGTLPVLWPNSVTSVSLCLSAFDHTGPGNAPIAARQRGRDPGRGAALAGGHAGRTTCVGVLRDTADGNG